MDNSTADIKLLAEIMQGKERFYNYMSLVFFRVPDNELLDMYIEAIPYLTQFVDDCTDAGISAGELNALANKIKAMSAKEREEYLTECNRAYSSTFYIGRIVPLTESNYLSATGNYNEENVEQVLLEYSRTGYKAELPHANEPADHIGFELGFMADLSHRMALCAENNDFEQMLSCLTIQNNFFINHIGRWYETLCDAVFTKGHNDCFFHQLVIILKAFMKEDYELTQKLMS